MSEPPSLRPPRRSLSLHGFPFSYRPSNPLLLQCHVLDFQQPYLRLLPYENQFPRHGPRFFPIEH